MRHRHILLFLAKATASGLLFIGALWLAVTLRDSAAALSLVERFGYLGMFLVAFASGFNLVVPIPAISFLPLFETAGFSVVSTIIVISIGMTLGDALGYVLGWFGRAVIADRQAPAWVHACEVWMSRYRLGLPLFLYFYAALVSLPNELVVIPAGFSRQSWWHVLLPVFLGNVTFNVLIAFGIFSLLG